MTAPKRGLGGRLYGAAHTVWQWLPRERRRAFFHSATAHLAPRPDMGFSTIPSADPITVAGLLTTASGLGEGARLSLAALQALGHDTRWADVSALFDQSDLPERPPLGAAMPARAGEGGTLLVHINAPYLPFALWRLGEGLVKRRKVIGYWAWELPTVSDNWRRGYPFVHEVWVPSRFTAKALVGLNRPVKVVPHPLPPPVVPAFSRSDLGIAPEALVVACFFQMGSSFTRKNPLAAVRAFRSAFGDDPNRILLLKVSEPDLIPWARQSLAEAVDGATNIRVFDRKMARNEVMGLLSASDILLSLHRAEGFGLVLAEAMQIGRTVVATGWSGNMDFMTTDNSVPVRYQLVPARDPQGTYDMPEQRWADAEVEDAAQWLRRLADDRDLCHRLAATAKAEAPRRFSAQAYADALA